MYIVYSGNKVISTSNLFEGVCDCMCYRYATPKWFNSVDDAERAICACKESNLPKVYDFSSFKEVEIYEAVITKEETEDGRPYTSPTTGKLVKKVKPVKGPFGIGLEWRP